MDGSSAITGALLQRELALSELAKHRFVILKLQFDPLSLDIYHPLVGLVVGLALASFAWLLCRPNFFVAACQNFLTS
jgi:hypothetical protein